MILPTELLRLIRGSAISCVVIALLSLAAFGAAGQNGVKIVRVHSPAELMENPALLKDHPFGVVTGIVRTADTDKPIPNAMITLVTKSLLEEKGLDGLDPESGRTRDDYLCRTITDGRGVFGFYYVPPEYLSQEFVLIVRAVGKEPVIRYGIVAERGKETAVSVQASTRH